MRGARTAVERDAACFANWRLRDNQQAAYAFFRSDSEVRKNDEVWDSQILDGRYDGDVGGAGAQFFSTLRWNGKGKVILALQRPVREAADEWCSVEVLHDGDAEFAHERLAWKSDYSRGEFCPHRCVMV